MTRSTTRMRQHSEEDHSSLVQSKQRVKLESPSLDPDLALDNSRPTSRQLTPQNIIHLQQSLGNRAVTRLLAGNPQRAPVSPSLVGTAFGTVQRLRTSKKLQSKITKDESQQKDLDTIIDLLNVYNAIKPKADPTYQQRLRALKELDTAIYAWFSAHITGAIAQTPNGTLLQGLLQETQEEHQSLIAGVAKNPGLLPIDTTGMGEDEQGELLKIWRSIIEGTGNLQIKGSKSFTKRMWAGIAQLLQTEAGQSLIGRINATQDDPSKNVTLGPEFKKELKPWGREDPKDSQAVPLTPDKDVTSMAYTVVSGGVSSLTDKDKLEVFKGTESPAAFHDFVTSLPPGTTHFQYGGQVYQVGTGVGSVVKMAGKGEVHANIGTEGQEVVVPEFVTMGHELGHALRFLTGTTVPFAEDKSKFGFKGSEAESKLWSNAEEFVNIQGVENEIREEHGIAKRQFHAGDWAKTQAPLINDQVNQLFTNPKAKAHPTEHNKIADIMLELMTLNSKRPTGSDKKSLKIIASIEAQANEILLSAKTRAAINEMYTLLKMEALTESGKSSGGDKPAEIDLTSSTKSPVPTDKSISPEPEIPSKTLTTPDKGTSSEPDIPPKTLTTSDKVPLSLPDVEVGVDVGAPVGGSAYQILKHYSTMDVEVPVDDTVNILGGSSSKKGKGVSSKKSGEGSAYSFLEREGYARTREQLGTWLTTHGIKVIPNGGGGANNCLIISLLQHAKRDYSPPKLKELWQYKQILQKYGVGENDPLDSTNKAFVELLGTINANYGRDMKVIYILAQGDNDPPYTLAETPIGSDPVVIWDKLGHFEPLTT